MKRYDYFKFLVIVLILIFMTGCTSIFTTPSEPVINSFTADPLTIIAGGSSTLSWDVSDATSVSINHEVGSSLDLISSATVSPTATTTYTLTATNDEGTVTASVQVTVEPITPPAKPDLVVTNIFRESGDKHFFYTIKNQGSTIAETSTSKFYFDGVPKDTDYVAAIGPGASRTEKFLNFTWGGFGFHSVKVEVDIYNLVDEVDESNNTYAGHIYCPVTFP